MPLMQLTSRKGSYLGDLMDAAYDAIRIDQFSRENGRVTITDKKGLGKEGIPMAPHQAERYKIKSSAERVSSRLKEDFGANKVMAEGHSKVSLHLMDGLITLLADQLLHLVGEVSKIRRRALIALGNLLIL